MDRIAQYQRLINIKPDYYELHSPYFMPTWYRFSANVKEFHLWFDEEFGVFRDVEMPQEPRLRQEKSGENKKFHKKDHPASKKRGGTDEIQSSIHVLYYEDFDTSSSMLSDS